MSQAVAFHLLEFFFKFMQLTTTDFHRNTSSVFFADRNRITESKLQKTMLTQ